MREMVVGEGGRSSGVLLYNCSKMQVYRQTLVLPKSSCTHGYRYTHVTQNYCIHGYCYTHVTRDYCTHGYRYKKTYLLLLLQSLYSHATNRGKHCVMKGDMWHLALQDIHGFSCSTSINLLLVLNWVSI